MTLQITSSNVGLKPTPAHGGKNLCFVQPGDTLTEDTTWAHITLTGGTHKGASGWVLRSVIDTVPVHPPPVPGTGPIIVPGPVAPLGIPGSFRLQWADEFDGAQVDPTRWGLNWLGATGATTPPVNSSELAAYAPSQVRMGTAPDGTPCLCLVAEAKPATVGGKTYPYTSGMIESNGKFTFTYGVLEVRAMTPAVPGSWSALWTDGQSWPKDGELDLLEAYGTDQSSSGHYHYLNPQTGNDPGPGFNATVVGASTAFHTYSVEWGPGLLIWRYDGTEVYRLADADLQGGAKITQSPQFIILNLAIQKTSDRLPATMLVDYVRVFSAV